VRVDGDAIRPFLALLLLAVGARILLRFSRPITVRPRSDADGGRDLVGPGAEGLAVSVTGGVGGVTNGLVGAWGPVVTPVLMHRGVPPRYAVGSVNTAEVAVAVVAAGSLLSGGNGAGLEMGVVMAMLCGGLVGAPLAAGVVRYIPARALGLACAGLLLLTQSRELINAGHVPVPGPVAYPAVLALVVLGWVRPRLDPRIDTSAAGNVGVETPAQ